MASDLFGKNFDIHAGGCDLKFPHHDNELAQSEAFYNDPQRQAKSQWVNHFWHAGHLNIHGLKMSKSLKNFTSIQQVLKNYNWRQIRIFFLCAPWHETINFSENSLTEASVREKELNEFILNMSILMREKHSLADHSQLLTEKDRVYQSSLLAAKSSIHSALCSNFDTPRVMQTMSALMTECTKYVNSSSGNAKSLLIQDTVRHIHSLLRTFGLFADAEKDLSVSGGSAASSDTQQLTSVLDAVCAFRDSMRGALRAALQSKSSVSIQELMELCDTFRDQSMIDCGVRMEDRNAGQSSVWKLEDPAKLKSERDAKKAAETIAAVEKLKTRIAQSDKELMRMQAAEQSPRDFYATQTDKYSKFDDSGKPTHDAAGEPLNKTAVKKIDKDWMSREKSHADFNLKNEQIGGKLLKNLLDDRQTLQQKLEQLSLQDSNAAKS